MNLTTLRDRIANKTAKIGVIGLGYVGLPVACEFARVGFDTLGIDIQSDRIEKINVGISPIEGNEPGLQKLLTQVINQGRLRATTKYETLQDRDIISINVETPVDENHKPQYVALRAVLRTLGPILKPGALVVVESTIAPGTMEGLTRPLLEQSTGRKLNEGFYLGHCPERVMPGKLLANLRNLSRVCGGATPKTAEAMVQLYAHVVQADLDATDYLTAELVKTTENAYRDVQIAFANEIALLCESLGADVWKVRPLVNKSPSRNMHLPGAGVGGHCIPKDGWLLIANAPESFKAHIIPHARQINESMPQHVFDLTVGMLADAGVPLSSARVVVMGYAYLENSDDTRHTPSDPLIISLQKAGVETIVHDPFVEGYKGDWKTAVCGADAAVFMVAHDAYRKINLHELKLLLRNPILVDGRHIFDVEDMRIVGLRGRCLGTAINL